MAYEPLTSEPEILSAGETVSWTRVSADYAASDGYTLKAYFAGPDTFTVTATDDDGTWLFEIASAETKTKAPGTYRWRIYAESGSEAADTLARYEVARGTCVLEANFATATPGSEADLAETMVAAIEAKLSGRLDADLESYGLAGRQAQMIPFERLHIELGIWKHKRWKAQNPGKSFPQHRVSFT